MTKSHQESDRLAEIGRLLDGHGADQARWPSGARERLEAAASLEPAKVSALVAEAHALDLVLAAAPAPRASPASERRLADRIVAAAMAGGDEMTKRPSAEVIPMPQRRIVAASPDAIARASTRPARWRNVAALMAASLLLGIILGGNVRLDPLLQDVAESVGLPSVFGVTTAALLDETGEEDAL